MSTSAHAYRFPHAGPVSTSQPGVDADRSYDLLDAIPSAVYVWRRGSDGTIRLAFANAAADRETRGRVRQLIGAALDELYADGPEIVAAIVATLDDGTLREMEHEYRFRSTGVLRWFRTTFMRTSAQEVVILNDDLTEPRLAATQLEASESRFRDLLERAPAIICTLRAPDHVYEMANEECRRIIGRDDIIGRRVADLLPEIAEQGLLSILDEVIATGEPFVAHAMPVILRPAPDEEPVERHLNVVVQAIEEADGTRTRTFTHAVDVTGLVTAGRDQHRLEAQLRESQKMQAIGRLAGGVAHDFNNLLSTILGYADLALLDPSASTSVRNEVEQIRRGAQRAAQLTRQLLAFGGRQIRRPTRIYIDDAVRDASRLLTPLLGERIELTLHADAGGAVVCMDPGELDQILLNLAVNARDAMPQGGNVAIVTSRYDGSAAGEATEHVLLSVSDTGSGIDAEAMPHIFEPFFTTKGKAGTGLGLSTVYGIVEQNQGRIEVDTRVGAGTRFRVYLPIATGDEPVKESPAPVRQMPPTSANVLLAEDEAGVRALARRVLERAGFHVFDARHGADAVRVWEQHADEIDIVVTDLVMPEMGGRALAERLREMRPGLPILFMSGYADDDQTREGVSDVRVAFLAKPFTTATLVNSVREALQRRR